MLRQLIKWSWRLIHRPKARKPAVPPGGRDKPPPATTSSEPPLPARPRLYERVDLSVKPGAPAYGPEYYRLNDEQQAVVRTKHGAQHVAAGAGSGKSTTLVVRFCSMVQVLGLPREHISVFTFTRRSREDFIAKLVKVSQNWPAFGGGLDERSARKRVRTFHSVALQLAKQVRGADLRVFELLAAGTSDDEELEVANDLAQLYRDQIESRQTRILRDAAQRAWDRDEQFRALVEALIIEEAPTLHREEPRNLQTAQETKPDECPQFGMIAPGSSQEVPFERALFEIGTFAENLALDPTQLDDGAEGEHATLLQATAAYFRHFRAHCHELNIATFNELFLDFAHSPDLLSRLPEHHLNGVKHLLIDEFQDVSPLMVAFIRALHSQIGSVSDVDDGPSVLAVGDDWQSIYGWRGSAPQFFLRFPNYFDGAAAEPLMLADNYRSSNNIVRAAQHLIESTSADHRMHKDTRAVGGAVADIHEPVYVIEKALNVEQQAALVMALQRIARLRGGEEVKVLTRTTYVQDELKTQLRRTDIGRWGSSTAQLMTVHSSKGLEADYVLILGDMSYWGSNSLRNALYARAGMEQTYDDAQADEALRLAYVAITRAKRLCIWIGRKYNDGAMSRLPDCDNVERLTFDAMVAKLEELEQRARQNPGRSIEVPEVGHRLRSP